MLAYQLRILISSSLCLDKQRTQPPELLHHVAPSLSIQYLDL